MKFYRAIIRNTHYSHSYYASVELFKTKKMLKVWFELQKELYYNSQDLNGKYAEDFNKVLVGIEEVNIK